MKIYEFKLDNIAGKSLKESFEKDYWGTVAQITEILLPKFIIGEIGITHRWITHWDDQGLIDNKRHGTEWRRFSFVEYIWLRIIVRLRDFNMPLKAIKQVKKFLFQSLSKDGLAAIIDSLSANIRNGLVPPIPGAENENYLEGLKKNLQKLRSDTKNMNLLFWMIFDMLFLNKPYCLAVTEKGECGLYFFGEDGTTEQSLAAIKRDIQQIDFITINLYKILQEFFSNEKVDESTIEKIAVLTDKEKQIIEMIRNNDFKELSIKQNNGKEYLVGIKRNKPIDKITDDVSSIIGRNRYQDIRLTTQNGKIINVEITEKLKI
jgi:DNA-binding transcriptional MerR regulator